MLARRLMPMMGKAAAKPPSIANLMRNVSIDPDTLQSIGLVSSLTDGSPSMANIPGITVPNQDVAASHQHGTVTVFGFSTGETSPDFGASPGIVSIFPCTAGGITGTPLEILPYRPMGLPLLCRDFAITSDGQVDLKNLRTNQERQVAVAGFRRFHGGSAITVAQQSFGSVQTTPAALGLTRTRQNTSSPFYLLVGQSTAEPIARSIRSYTDVVEVPWTFARETGDVVVRRATGMTISTARPARRHGACYSMATVVCSEILHTTPGQVFEVSGTAYSECDLTIAISRRVGILKVLPSGAMQFFALQEQRYDETQTVWRRTATAFHLPGLVDWPALSVPLSTVLDLPRPTTDTGRLWALADRLVDPTSGRVRGWGLDGTPMGDHPYTGFVQGVLEGESVLVTFDSFSRNAGATWQPLASGAVIPSPQNMQTLRLY